MTELLLDQPQIEELCRFAYYADREARSDLFRHFIRDEDDYTANLTGALRRNINAYSVTGLTATSFMLGTRAERNSGTDATIIIRSGPRMKVALFEAKLPRLKGNTQRWDYAQTATGLSHFSD